jgi:hypothetical protein
MSGDHKYMRSVHYNYDNYATKVSKKVVKAAKAHECFKCGEAIQAGNKYSTTTIVKVCLYSGHKQFTNIKQCLSCAGVKMKEVSYLDALNSGCKLKVSSTGEMMPGTIASEYIRTVRDACRQPASTTIDFAKFQQIFDAEANLESWHDEALMECRLAHIPTAIQYKACDIMKYRKFTTQDNPSHTEKMNCLNDPYHVDYLSRALTAISNSMYYDKGWVLRQFAKDYLDLNNMHIDCLKVLIAADPSCRIEGLQDAYKKVMWNSTFDGFFDMNTYLEKIRPHNSKIADEIDKRWRAYNFKDANQFVNEMDKWVSQFEGTPMSHAMIESMLAFSNNPNTFSLKLEMAKRLGQNHGILVWFNNENGQPKATDGDRHFYIKYDPYGGSGKAVTLVCGINNSKYSAMLNFPNMIEAQLFAQKAISMERRLQGKDTHCC